MSRRRPDVKMTDADELVGLRLPVPEREVIITSGRVEDRRLQDRVRNAPAREVVSFTMEELEDLHRGLAFDANHTPDKKREKLIRKVLREIEELIDEEDDFDEFEPWLDEWGDQPPVPTNPQQIFEHLFGAGTSNPDEAPPSCRVALTASQRETLRGMDTVSVDIHKMVAVESQEELEFDFSPRQVLVVSLALKEALNLSRDNDSATPFQEIAQRIADGLFAAIEDAADEDAENRYRQSQGGLASVAYQLKITLEGSKPAIWRRVQVADCTLDVLHQIVQTAMGWTNSHLHMFEDGEDHFSDPRFELDAADYDETQVYLSQLVANGCQKLRYWYDFGDDWWHTIKIEKTLEPKPTDQFPKCIKGAGACPPEDCGGMWGYYEFLDAIRDSKHERHDELVEWAGEDFDPNDFDIEETNEALALAPVDEFDA